MNALDYIAEKYSLNLGTGHLPIEIPNMGRDDLAALFAELGFTIGVEIGVQQGKYSRVLCEANPGLTLYGVDPWKTYKGYREHVTQVTLDRFFEEAKTVLAPFDWRPIKNFSMDAVRDFKDSSIDFVFIDGNHDLQHVINDIVEWSKKVRPGGIVSGHDFVKRSKPTGTHVIQAVQSYTYCYDIRPWFLLGLRQRIEGMTRDKSRSWMWVKT